MTNDELLGRLAALEVLALTSLGLYMANSRNDPDYSKATALLDYMREMIMEQAKNLSPEAQIVAKQYGDHLIDQVSHNLRSLRGEGGATH